MAGVRGVLSTGWGGLSVKSCPPEVCVVDDIPHGWLFPRTAAVVHHGGAGTTAAGLLAGRPTVICPFIADQPFWGKCVHERGLGPAPLPQRRLTAARLGAAIRQAVQDPSITQACRRAANTLGAEDGVQVAVGLLERIAAGTRYPSP